MKLSETSSGDPDLPVYRADNGTVALAFLPTIGGRLISVSAHGREFLWRNPAYVDDTLRAVIPLSQWPRYDGTFASWANVGGSKTWPAPQGWGGEGEWAGPPDPVLDSGAWSIASDASGDDLEVTMTSADDPRSGLRVTRKFVLPGSGSDFVQHTTFTNISARAVTWAVWEVAQVDTGDAARLGGVVEIGVADERIVDLGSYHGTLGVTTGPGTASVSVQDVVVKRGFPSSTGRISYRESSGAGIELAFDPVSDGLYPDQGSRAELWMQAPLAAPIPELGGLHPDASLVELEVLSPLTNLGPGTSVTFEVRWRLFPAAP